MEKVKPPSDDADTSLFTRVDRLRQQWRDASLSLLLVVQSIVLFLLVPAAALGYPFPPSLAVVILLVVMSLTAIVARGRWFPLAGLLVLVLSGTTALLQRPGLQGRNVLPGNMVGLAAFVLLTAVIFRAVFSPGRITGHRVVGAIALYLNVGFMFAFCHRIVAELVPGAYSHIPSEGRKAVFNAALDFYSFATLTSLGAGDMTPTEPISHSLTILEAGMGQLLPVILISRVVTMAMQQKD